MSRIPFGSGALLCPVPPVLVTTGNVRNPNVMTAAWTGVINTKPPKTYISIRPERYTHELLLKTGEAVLNLTTADLVEAADFCGVRSGRNTDKFKKCGLHAEESSVVSAPTLSESPLSLECRVFERIPLGSHDMFLLDVVAVTVKEELIDKDGRLALEKCRLAAYAHGSYYELGKQLGTFGYSVRRKKKRKTAKKPKEQAPAPSGKKKEQ